jgi:hypothetical protein
MIKLDEKEEGMKRFLFLFCCVGILIFSVGASAEVLYFDSLPSDTINPIPNGYGGFNWNNMYAFDPDPSLYPGYAKGVISPYNVAYNGFGDLAVTSTGGATFDFNGAYFTSAWIDNNLLTLQGYLGGSLLFTTTANLMTSGPLFVSAKFNGIDEVVFSTSNAQFAMDNFTYNASAVPEPATFLLFGGGLAGLTAYRFRSKKA